MVVLLTVGLSVPLEEVPGPDLLLAVGAHKVLGVPCLPHGGHNLTGQTDTKSLRARPGAKAPGPTSLAYLPSDGLLAGSADPFGNGGDP